MSTEILLTANDILELGNLVTKPVLLTDETAKEIADKMSKWCVSKVEQYIGAMIAMSQTDIAIENVAEHNLNALFRALAINYPDFTVEVLADVSGESKEKLYDELDELKNLEQISNKLKGTNNQHPMRKPKNDDGWGSW